MSSPPPNLPPLLHPHAKRKDDGFVGAIKRDWIALAAILAALGAGWTWHGRLQAEPIREALKMVTADHEEIEHLKESDVGLRAQVQAVLSKFEAINLRFDEQRAEMMREHQEDREDIRALRSGAPLPRLTPTPEPPVDIRPR